MTDAAKRLSAMAGEARKGELAAWLLACPLGLIASHHIQIRTHMASVGFGDGVRLVDAELHALQSPRMVDGDLPTTVVLARENARSLMRETVRRGRER